MKAAEKEVIWMFLKYIFLLFIGSCCGAAIAAGVFAFSVCIGVIARFIGKSHTSEHIYLYEHMVLLGGLYGNLMSLFDVPMVGGIFGISVFGIFSGIFIGCLSISIAEILDVFPILFRRIQIKVGLPLIFFSFGIGKMAGSLLYFYKGLKG